MVRRGIAGLLSSDNDCQVCGEASDADETIRKAGELRPEVILLDVSMPDGNGMDTARRLLQQIPETKIVIMSHHDPAHLRPLSLEAGARACIDKARIFTDLLPTIRSL